MLALASFHAILALANKSEARGELFQRRKERASSRNRRILMSTTITRSAVPTGTWTIDPAHSKVGFAVKHMGIATVRGEFAGFEGTLEISDDLGTATARGIVKAETV